MNGKDIEKKHYQTFDSIKETDSEGREFWTSRKLSKILDYSEYRHFLPVVERAKEACKKSGHEVSDHFEEFLEMVEIGLGAKRKLEDIKLSRYACYLIVQNGDPSKPVIANGQTYFAIQTRRQELADDEAFQRLREEEKRLFLRNEMREHNKQLVEVAQQAGVKSNLDFAIFQNHGYKRKTKANKTHFEVGKKVRQTIEELGGTMPEDLPTPEEDLKKQERRVKSAKKKMIKNNKLLGDVTTENHGKVSSDYADERRLEDGE
jgi:DNA-damage-inducible protein D